MTEDILSQAERRELATYTGTSLDMNDSELLSHAADRMGMEGELAIDPEGVLELELDGVLVVLESVAAEDRDEVDHPDRLHLAVLLDAAEEEARARLREADLLDDDAVPVGDDGRWVPAWWGSMCTRLGDDAPLSTRLEAVNRVMQEAHTVLARGELAGFFDRMAWLQLDDTPDDED
jgi:hypothetical protein